MSIQLNLFDPPSASPVCAPPQKKAAAARPSRTAHEAPHPRRRHVPGSRTVHFPAAATPPATLAEVMRWLNALDPEVPRNRDMRSALNGVSKVLNLPLDQIATEPRTLAKLFANALPALQRMTPKRWSRVRGLVRIALQEAGVKVTMGRATQPLTANWKALEADLGSQRQRVGLSRLMHFFSARGAEPADVTELDFELYREALNGAILTNPTASFDQAVRLWNEVASTHDNLRAVVFERSPDPRRYSLPWSEFPQTFPADVEAFLHRSGTTDVLADEYIKRVKPSTIEVRRRSLRQAASALVASGFPIEQLTDLRVLVSPTNAKAALHHLLDRRDGEIGVYIAAQAQLLCTIARYWVKAPVDADVLQGYASSLQPERAGMTPKNRQRLRQFDLEENLKVLLTLPAQLRDEIVRSDDGGREAAQRMMMAVLLEMLLMVPLRLGNYAAMQADRHLPETLRGRRRMRHLVLTAKETKTSRAFQAPIHADTNDLLELYLTTYRPRLTQGESPYLFPGRHGGKRSVESMSRSVSSFLLRETGLVMNAHLFRHLAALIYLRKYPDRLEDVRQLLGHTTTRTAARSYVEIEAEFAVRAYEAVVSDRRKAFLSSSSQKGAK